MNRQEKLQNLVRDAFGGNQAAFAKAIGRAPAQVNHWLTGHRKLGDAGARHIEITLNLGIGYFDGQSRANTIQADLTVLEKESDSFAASGKRSIPVKNTDFWQGPSKRVPLISWVKAGDWCEAIDNFAPGDADEWYMCPVNHSESTYVLQVRGESMYNPSGRPSFQEGDLIFVDPQRSAEHGSLVVVRLDDEKEVTFKKLIIEGDRKYLKALNPSWPEPIIPINGNATMCGVVIFKGEKL